MAEAAELWLAGDIGGTHARFGLVSPDATIHDSRVMAAADFPNIAAAIRAYLGGRGDRAKPRRGALAIAAPITGDAVRMTNHPWAFSVAALQNELGLEQLKVINDFTAVALALPH